MSLRWIRKLVVAAALAVMPFQGIAATLTVLLCHGDAQAHATHAGPAHDHGEHGTAAQHDHAVSDHEGDSDSRASYHLCCNLTASAPPSFAINAELPDFPVQAFVPVPLYDLFVPEQPQRPPLA